MLKDYKLDTLNKDVLKQDSSVFLAVSCWADSMFMLSVVIDFYKKYKLSTENLTILHYNHCFREQSKQEEKYLKDYSKKIWIKIIVGKYNWKIFTENALRKARYEFFEQQLFKNKNKEKILITWHNLDDRIETTFLNMMRGCHISWMLNMNILDTKNIEIENIWTYKIFRPLLNLPKQTIFDLCDSNKVKYFQDNTNFDETISKRNFMRKKIQEIVQKSNVSEGISQFYNSFLNFYNSYLPKTKEEKIKEITLSKYCNYSWAYEYVGDVLSTQDTCDLLKSVWIYKNISNSMLAEITQFLMRSKWWNIFIWGVYIFKLHKRYYLIKWEKNFWENVVELDIKIDKINTIYKTKDFDIKIEKKEYIWGKIRFWKKWDSIDGKKLSKYFIDKKIPLFWRNYTPLIEKDWKILEVLAG